MQLHPAQRAQVGQVPAGGAHDVPAVAVWHGGGPHHGQAHGALKNIIQGVHENLLLLKKFLIIMFAVFNVRRFKFRCLKHSYFEWILLFSKI